MNKKIPFVDLKAQYHSIKTEIDDAISKVINDTAFIGGEHVDAFEKNFAELYGVKHCIPVANGTDSLYIILKMLGIGSGDEVITVANSWISSAETISQTGARPVFIDIDPQFYSINEALVEKYITPATKAIIPVHLQGQMCEMDFILELARKYNLNVIEDCAQSHFSEYKGKYAGTMGIAGSFSFYPGKNLGAYGDAGCIITNNADLALKCKMYSRHGALKKHEHIIEGINSRLDGIQAAILNAKLPHILEWTEKRIAVAGMYDEALAGIPQVVRPVLRPQTKHTYHLYVIRVKDRAGLMEMLKNSGVETAIHYPTPLPSMQCYQYLNPNQKDFPIVNAYQGEILSLPIYPEMTAEDVSYIANLIRNYYS